MLLKYTALHFLVNFLNAVSTGVEPRSYSDVIKDSKWCAAMHEEITALKRMGLGLLRHYLKGRNTLVAYGCIKLSIILMTSLNGTKPVFWFMVILRLKVSIILRHLLQSVN